MYNLHNDLLVNGIVNCIVDTMDNSRNINDVIACYFITNYMVNIPLQVHKSEYNH